MRQSSGQIRSSLMMSVRVLQISGISLMTLCLLNGLFMSTLGWRIDIALLMTGLFLLCLSFLFWQSLQWVSRLR